VIVDNELERIRKEAIVIYFNVFWRFPRNNEENPERTSVRAVSVTAEI
jgi:hypothetical protein